MKKKKKSTRGWEQSSQGAFTGFLEGNSVRSGLLIRARNSKATLSSGGQCLLASQLTIYRRCLSRGLKNGHKETIHTKRTQAHTRTRNATAHSNSQRPSPLSGDTAKPAKLNQGQRFKTTLYTTKNSLPLTQSLLSIWRFTWSPGECLITQAECLV